MKASHVCTHCQSILRSHVEFGQQALGWQQGMPSSSSVRPFPVSSRDGSLQTPGIQGSPPLGESSSQEQRCAQGTWLCSQRTWPASDSQPLSEIALSGPRGSIALPSDIIPQTNPTRKEMWIVSINGVSGSWGETQRGVCCKRLHPAARKQKLRFSPLSSCPADRGRLW